jgi:hypothetical protein
MHFSHFLQKNNSFYFLTCASDTYDNKYILFNIVVLAIPRRRCSMPQVADISDSVQEDWLSSVDEALPLRPTTPLGQHRFSLLAGLRGLISLTRRVCMRRGRYGAPRMYDFERPVDTLARQHPYLYIKAMSS